MNRLHLLHRPHPRRHTANWQRTKVNGIQSTDKQRSTAEGKVNGQRGSRHLRPQRPPHNKPPPKGGWGDSPLHHRRQEVPGKINQADTTPTLHLRSNRQEKILTLFCALSHKSHVSLPLSTRCLCRHDALCLPTQHVAFIFEARFNGRQNTPIFIQKHHLSVHYHRSFANRHLASCWRWGCCQNRKKRPKPPLRQKERHFSHVRSHIIENSLTFSWVSGK